MLPRPLKFCMLTTFYPPYHFGGDGVYVYRLAEALAARGHQVDVMHSVDAYRLQHPGEPDVVFTHHPNIRRFALESARPRWAALAAHQLGRTAWYTRQLRALLDARGYDVIHYHNISLMGGPGVLRLGRAVKLYTAHEYWLICPTHVLFAFNRQACTQKRCLTCTLHSGRPPQAWRYTGFLQRCLGAVDCLLMPSRFALERHRAEGLDRPMVHLPCFVAAPVDQAFQPDGKYRQMGKPDLEPALASASDWSGGTRAGSPCVGNRPYFLYAGRLEKLKGVQELLRLFRNYDRADLVIAGTGSLAAALREEARCLPHVSFCGQVHPAALGELYRRALGVLVPSLCYETFGQSAAEALAQGTPVIVRRIGALTEIIDQSGAGFAFTTLDECIQAMERLRTDADLRSTLGRRGLQAAAQHWSTEVHLDQYLDLVNALLEKKDGNHEHEAAVGRDRPAEPLLRCAEPR